ncbi:unnamed protein product [Larinioides sclopetarius]|uniref:Uncharacterized protein n=1 Tax=Larinioides sclopetarius TaxID=280406 RepID=A0AAV2B074_9ARAC
MCQLLICNTGTKDTTVKGNCYIFGNIVHFVDLRHC